MLRAERFLEASKSPKQVRAFPAAPWRLFSQTACAGAYRIKGVGKLLSKSLPVDFAVFRCVGDFAELCFSLQMVSWFFHVIICWVVFKEHQKEDTSFGGRIPIWTPLELVRISCFPPRNSKPLKSPGTGRGRGNGDPVGPQKKTDSFNDTSKSQLLDYKDSRHQLGKVILYIDHLSCQGS